MTHLPARPARPASALALAAVLAFAAAQAAAAGQGTLIVLNKSEATASLIDLDSGRVAATIPTGEGPHEVAVSPDGRLAVVTNYGTGPKPGSSLTVLEVPAARVVRTIDLGEHRRPHGVAFLPGGGRVAVTAEGSQALLAVDVETGKVLSRTPTAQEVSHMVVLAPDGARAFVANIGSGSLTIVDLPAAKRLVNLPTGAGAEGITMLPGGREVWVTNRDADTISVVDVAAMKVVAELPCKAFPIRAQASPDGKRVLVSNARSGDIAVFDAAARKELIRIPMPVRAAGAEGRLFGERFGGSPVPIGILIRPDGKRAYVANSNADRIVVLDLEAWTVAGELQAGREPDGLGHSRLAVTSGPS